MKGFDVILSNPPYIAQNHMGSLMADVRDHEPHIALFSKGEDGLDSFRVIIEKAAELLSCNGVLFFEVGFGQADQVASLISQKREYNN
ncbi:MAG: protein-(glutamine-N5) methyltransferase, release factor-specific, partial [Ignavibacteriae bacterium]|nr:protein-(glutamine-N5) methyltransferase, release factor-specific [Ignavibacteriota bacterium]